MSKKAIILIAHGARDPEWAAPMRRVWAAIQAQRPDQRIELAFLDLILFENAPVGVDDDDAARAIDDQCFLVADQLPGVVQTKYGRNAHATR